MIRPATEADFDKLVSFGHDFFKVNPCSGHSVVCDDSLRATFLALITEHVLLVDERDGVVDGCAAAFVGPVFWNFNDLQATEAFWWLDVGARGNGRGDALRQALESAVKERGVKFWNMVALETSSPQIVGAKYMKAGMKPTEHIYMKVFQE